MKLSTKINVIILPIIICIFSLAGSFAYYNQKALLRSALSEKLSYEAEYIVDDMQKSISELERLLEMFLGSMEVTQYLIQPDGAYRDSAIEPQLLNHLSHIGLTQGRVTSFGLFDYRDHDIMYYDALDPFGSFQHSSNLIQHQSRIRGSIQLTGISYVHTTTYEFSPAGEREYDLIIYKTFSPYQPISEKAFSSSLQLYTAVITAKIDTFERYLSPLQLKFTPQATLDFVASNAEIQLDSQLIHLTPSSESNGLSAQVSSALLSARVHLPQSFLHSLYSPYHNAIISLVINMTLITFLFLKWLIHRQVIRPVVKLTDHIEEAKQGDISQLKKVDRKDEIASLNNNYIELLTELHQLAKFDQLTGLANRNLFNASIARMIEHSSRTGTISALLYIDLDNFKSVNDTYGHHVGDQLLQNFAERLQHCFRLGDTLAVIDPNRDIARLAGDEFALLLSDMPNMDTIAKAAKRITSLCSNGFEFDDTRYDIRVSVGISICPDDAVTPESLLKRADAAMYQVKNTGKNGFQFFSKHLEQEMQRHAFIESALKQALEEESFYLVFMPIFDCRTGQISGAEALLRSHSKALNDIGPAEFIPIAEITGLIQAIDYWVLDAAVGKLRVLIDQYNFQGVLAVNFSALQLKNPSFVDDVKALLMKYAIPPQQLEMEITETSFIPGEEQYIAVLRNLQKLGINLALDDFGTGFTAFSQLMDYPVQTLKIDRRFIHTINEVDDTSKPLVDIIVELADLYNLKVVTEGVENQRQLDHVRRLGCDRAQGFFLSKPIRWEAFIQIWSHRQHQNSFVIQNEKLEFSYRSLSGSVKIQVSGELIIHHFKGIITTDTLNYALSVMPQCVQKLPHKHWGYMAITENYVDMTQEFQLKMAELVHFCQDNGCVEAAYVIQNMQIIGQLYKLRKAAGITDDLKTKLFTTPREAEIFLNQLLSHYD